MIYLVKSFFKLENVLFRVGYCVVGDGKSAVLI